MVRCHDKNDKCFGNNIIFAVPTVGIEKHKVIQDTVDIFTNEHELLIVMPQLIY